MKIKKDYGSVVLYYVEPYWYKGMYFETEIRIKNKINK